MNGSENWYAGAMFFTLISLGALLKLDDVIGFAVGAVSAILAAISLRRALVKTAQATEEDHQRMEIQFQQLRSKIIETSSVSIEAMNSMIDAAHLLQENLQTIRIRLAELDNLTELTKSVGEINVAVTSLEENSFARNAELEKIIVAIQTHEESVTPKFMEELKTLNDTNDKIVNAVQSQEQQLKTSLDSAQKELSELVKINSGLSKNCTK